MEITVRFAVPLPPIELSPNGRTAWQRKMKPKADYRDHSQALALCKLAHYRVNHGVQPVQYDSIEKGRLVVFERAVMSVRLFLCKKAANDLGRYRPNDYDNLLAAIKPAQDGIVLAGWLVSDSYKRVKIGSLEIEDAPMLTRSELYIILKGDYHGEARGLGQPKNL